MAEWVLKGNLKGPQGDPGQDAQLPAGGTEGQVLTKTSGGEAWADVPQPDMTGVVKVNSSDFLEHDGQRIAQIHVSGVSNADTIIGSAGSGVANITAMGQSAAQIIVSSGDDAAGLIVSSEGPTLKFGDKYVASITDAIPDSQTGNALVTDKAVADYVTAKVPSVTLPLPVSQGGTGATTAEGARTALGIPDLEVATDEEFDSYMGLS